MICQLVTLYLFIVFARIVVSWFPIQPGTFMAQAASVLYQLTEPVLGPIRRILPPVGFGGMGLDLSPLIVIFFLQFFVLGLVC